MIEIDMVPAPSGRLSIPSLTRQPAAVQAKREPRRDCEVMYGKKRGSEEQTVRVTFKGFG